MSDELKVSEREAVLRERKAFERGYRTRPYELAQGGAAVAKMKPDEWEQGALRCVMEREYPLPKVSRPRVLQEHGTGFKMRYVNGHFEHHVDDGKGWRWSVGRESCAITQERVKMWADLLANPTELVEAE